MYLGALALPVATVVPVNTVTYYLCCLRDEKIIKLTPYFHLPSLSISRFKSNRHKVDVYNSGHKYLKKAKVPDRLPGRPVRSAALRVMEGALPRRGGRLIRTSNRYELRGDAILIIPYRLGLQCYRI